ncbi:MAG TPA: response regulator [candidate division Zixibacteria bacterium]|nr:response regulator [candidate division Zixibacteria bacterium]MDD4917000.1 response regulator [candidate division Zixibacteria bacterium]MDM7972609.1 response regulator [candidate division Zixibacteria bacterium]HOD66167.1 response regulator [candidate division Zixibacteria bacterium]HPC11114.1 response regulator [candidate division Zixibacteria bacterium]
MARILIIDDSEVIRNLLEEYLTDAGYEVETACDGREGIDRALGGDFDVAFCDIHMPHKNGYQVFREVRRRKPGMAFIMTDSLPDQLAEMAQNEGAHCCLTKPFDLNQVRRVLETLLAKARTV